jgi:hypothetical protein
MMSPSAGRLARYACKSTVTVEPTFSVGSMLGDGMRSVS